MAKVKYDYTDVDESQVGYDGEDPKPGIYQAKVSTAEMGQSKAGNPMVTVTIDITQGEYKGWRGWHYLVMTEESAWKVKEFTDAVGLTKPGKKKGTWDTDDAVGKPCRIKVRREMYEGEAQAKIRSVLAPKGDADEDDEPEGADEEPAGDEAEPDEPEGDEPEGDEPEGDEDEAKEARREALGEMNRAALKKELAKTDSELKVTTKVTDEQILEAILEAEFPEEAEGEVWTWDDIKDEDRAGLKKIIADEELEVTVTKKMTDDAVRAAVAAALEIEPPEDGEPPF